MSSRKTYFGIGWPKDPTEPDQAAPAKSDAEDRSAPTVVDDEKVAEGLKQLRTWYQSDETKIGNPMDDGPKPTPVPSPARPGARPTAVGNATGPPPAAQHRPAVPDPMRATQYGHDVHQFEFDAAAASSAATPPSAESTALVVANRGPEGYGLQAEAFPSPIGASPSGPFELARQGEAQRLHRPGAARKSASHPVPAAAAARVPLYARLVLVIGVVCLVAAVLVVWLQPGGGSESTTDTPPPVGSTLPALPAPAPRAPVPPPAPAAAALPAAPAVAPAKTAATPERS